MATKPTLRPVKENVLSVREKELSSKDVGGDSSLRSTLASQFTTAQNNLRYFSLDWNDYEDLVAVKSRTADNSHRRLSDGTLSSIVIERAGRNASQMPIGSITSNSLANVGQAQLMDLVLHKHILPNANEQYDFATKMFLWNMYSNTYGTMVMQYDWSVRNDYTGPDCWLVPIRNYFIQQGRFSIQNSDYVFVSNFVSRDFLQGLIDNNDESWDLDAVQIVLNKSKDKALVPKARLDYLRNNPEFEFRRRAPFTDTGQIEVVTKYESSIYTSDVGHWTAFCPDYENIVIRNIGNPHKSGVIPLVEKFSIPTLDSPIGFGDAERGALLQWATDTTLNLQVDAQKLRTYPPIKIINGNVVMPTVRFTPGAKWMVTTPNDITHHQFPEVDTSTNQIYQYLKGALNNVSGNTTTEISAENTDTTQGKTPASIKAQQASQSTRDSIDTMLMEQSVEKLINGMVDLVSRIPQQKPIELFGFGQEVQQIAKNYPDIMENIKFVNKNKGLSIYDASAIKIDIKPNDLITDKGYRYKIQVGSTKKADKENQENIASQLLTDFLPQAPMVNQLMEMSGKTIDFGSLIETIFQNSGLSNLKEIIKPMSMGNAPGQQGPTNQGNGQTGEKQKLPNELINFKDVVAQDPQVADAMLQQAGLPPMQQPQAQSPQGQMLQGQPQQSGQSPVGIGNPEIAQAKAAMAAQHQQFLNNLGVK